jgi:hypothetical protein
MQTRNIGSPHAGQRRWPIGGAGRRNLRGCGMIISPAFILMAQHIRKPSAPKIDFDIDILRCSKRRQSIKSCEQD